MRWGASPSGTTDLLLFGSLVISGGLLAAHAASNYCTGRRRARQGGEWSQVSLAETEMAEERLDDEQAEHQGGHEREL